MLDTWIDGEYNCQPYNGRERQYKGMSRIEVWNSTITEVRRAKESDLNLILMKTTRKQKVKRNGVSVTIAGQEFWFNHPIETLQNLKREVYVRYDPADFSTARIYDAETDKFLFEWKLADILMVAYLSQVQEDVADAQEQIHKVQKFARDQAKRQRKPAGKERITMLDIEQRRASAKLADGFEIRMPKNMVLVQSGEEIPEKKAAGAENLSVQMNLKLMRENALKLKGE